MRAPGGKLVLLGEHDEVDLYVGNPGSGKTFRMMRHGGKRAKQGYPVVCWDPNANMTRVARSQSPVPPMRLDTREPLLPLVEAGTCTITRRPPAEILTQARAYSDATLTGGREESKTKATPVLVFLDELSLWKATTKAGYGDPVEEWLGQRRHYHVSFHGGCQWPRQIHSLVFTAATTLWLHRIDDRYDLERLRAGGVSAEVCKVLPALAPWHCLEVNRKKGTVLHHEP